MLLDTIKQIRKHVNPQLAIAGFVPTLFSNANQDKVILEALEKQLAPLAKLYPVIPRATEECRCGNESPTASSILAKTSFSYCT